ncbi:MAG: FtsX-like permease family protein [Bacteroidales bacterium]|jgi:ABC-type lipoprotein release transport system permease subunit|nr:FtsX-like permease family protein [Bacteroidales bacterium]
MTDYVKIAWRNLWRNRRRTLITIASVLFALFLALVMRSMQLGSYSSMVESAVKSSTGYIQVHKMGYWDDKSIDNTFEINDSIESAILGHPNVNQIIPRLECFALLSSGKQTKGSAVIGTDPGTEDIISGLKDRIISGEYLDAGDQAILVAEGLAQYLKVTVGDTLVILGQGYHGMTAAGAYPVKGIIRFVQPDINNSMTYIPLRAAQELYSSPRRLTSLSIMLADPDKIRKTRDALVKELPASLEVMNWNEMLVELVQAIEGDNISGQFTLGILYLVVGFGILGTILMSTMERRKEFGIMVAVGMRRTKLAVIVFIESLLISLIGIVAGVLTSLPLIFYFYHHPIPLTGDAAEAMIEYNMEPVMPFLLEPGYFINQSVVVIIITMLTMVYPMTVIGRFKIINAIKGR